MNKNGKDRLKARLAKPAIATVAVCGIGMFAAAHIADAHRAAPRVPMVYSSSGFGGMVPAELAAAANADPVAAIDADYRAGRYSAAEQKAQTLVLRDENDRNASSCRDAARALRILAYCEARQGEYSSARDSFYRLRESAAKLPDHGAAPSKPGEQEPTLEEEGAFQHAVCVSALNDKQGAESEYNEFLKEYPKSILMHAAVKRVARLHGGDVPAATDRLRKQALALQKAEQDAGRRSEAMCGPECLAELLKRNAKQVAAAALADEMGTTVDGTSMEALRRTAGKHGVALKGVCLSQSGLEKLRLPVIALMEPGHFVLVESVSKGKGSVAVWDPDLNGAPGRRTYTAAQWTQLWHGYALE